MTSSLEVLYEDNHLLVINKPAGLATMGAESGPTVHSLAAEYIKRKYNKPGRVFVGIVSRLDTMTSGVIVLARTSKAASRLSAQFAAKTQINTRSDPNSKSDQTTSATKKWYLAAIEGHLDEQRGTLSDRIRKDDSARRMRIVGSEMADAQEAALRYGVVEQGEDWTSIAVELLTGRKHQIRVQFADRGHPVIGDRKYKSVRSFPNGIALHSWRLQITHPTKKTPIFFEAPLPRHWNAFRSRLQTSNEIRMQVQQALKCDLDSRVIFDTEANE